MSLTWEAIGDAARLGDTAAVTAMLLDASEQQRLALGKDLTAQLKSADLEPSWGTRPAPATVWGLAVLGTAPTAAQAAAALGRSELLRQWDQIPVPYALRLLHARDLPWLGDLAQRLANRLRPGDSWSGAWEFVSVLLAESGTTPPVTEGVVRGWLVELHGDGFRDDLVPFADRLRQSPHFDVLLPALFEIDGLGTELDMTSWEATGEAVTTGPMVFPDAVARFVAEGRLERKTILAATVDRLVRGDRPACLRPFAALHDVLAPTIDELATHALDYARLLPDAPSTVAGLAQRALRAVDEAGRLDLETLLEVSRPTLVRKEKTLVKAQLSWLERVARRETDRAGEVFETVASAFDHPALDVQERALTLIERQAKRLDPGTSARLAEAVPGLGGDLPARAARLFGPASFAPVAESTLLLPPPVGPAAMPTPIGSVAELAEEISALVQDDETPVRYERVLAGLVALRDAEDKAPLEHLFARHIHTFDNEQWWPRKHALGAAIRRVLNPSLPDERQGRGHWQRLVTVIRAGRRGEQRLEFDGPPARLLTLRLVEIAALLRHRPVSTLVATPTHVNGSLDAVTLVDRLRRAEAEGWEPWPLDLEQALIRLPRATSLEVTAGLTSTAGRCLTEWLTGGGLPDPVSTRFEQPAGEEHEYHYGTRPPVPRFLATVAPARPGLLSIEDALVTVVRDARTDDSWTAPVDNALAAAALPHHREVSAAWALPELAALADQDQRDGASLLPLLAECAGPIGPAMSLSLAYVLAARHESDRAAAVDAFLALAAGPEPFAAAVGRDLAELTGRGLVKLNRAVLSLTDAHRAGASAAVWAALAAALPSLLAQPPRGLPDLLELACLAAAATGARDEVPGLSEVADRKGTNRLVGESRRLRSVLTS